MTWTATGAARRTWRLLRDDWTAIPRRARAAFAWTLAAGWVAGLATMAGVSLLLRGDRGRRLDAREAELLPRVVDAIPLDYSMAVFLESPGNGVIVLPLTVVAFVVLVRRRRPMEAFAVLASSLLAAVMVGVGWIVWERARPEFLYPDVPPSELSAFPSGHASMAIAFYGTLGYLWFRGTASRVERVASALLILLMAVVVSAARLVLGSHWPSDVVAGWILGIFWLSITIHALRRGAATLKGA